MYKLLIVDDEPLVQVGIKSMIDCTKYNIEITGVVGNGKAALDSIEENLPDIVITDIKMPIMSGLELIRNCREKYGNNHPVFIILTSFEEFQLVKEAIKYNVLDYIIKLELTPESLGEALEKAISKIQSVAPSHNEAENALELSSSHLSDKFYIRLLHGMYNTSSQIDMQCDCLNIKFPGNYFTCLYAEFFSYVTAISTPEKYMALFHSSIDLFSELLAKYVPSVVITLDAEHCAIIVFSENAAIVDLNSIIHKLNDSLKSYYNTGIKCAIGCTVNSPIDICTSYQYARQAYSYLTSNKICISSEECIENNYNHQIFNMSIFKDDLDKAFEEYDSETLEQIIKELSDLFMANPKRNFQALDAACSILHIAINALPDGEAVISKLFYEYPDNYRFLYRLKSTEQIVEWLNVFCTKLSAYFNENMSITKNHTVTSVKRYIQEHISEKLSLNDTAEKFNISPSYLSQLFKKYNDIGFNEYVTCQKVNEAKRLLAEGKLKIYEISDMLGFESAFYFSKVFKKIEGISPKDYTNQKL